MFFAGVIIDIPEIVLALVSIRMSVTGYCDNYLQQLAFGGTSREFVKHPRVQEVYETSCSSSESETISLAVDSRAVGACLVVLGSIGSLEVFLN